MRPLASAGIVVISLALATPIEARDCGASGRSPAAATPARAGCAVPRSLRDEAEAVQAGKLPNSADLGGVQVRVTGRVRAEVGAQLR